MHIMLACHFDNAGTRRKTFLDDPTFLGRRPTPPPLRTRQNRNLAHVCSFACKSLSKLSQAKLQPGRRPSPEGYAKALGVTEKAWSIAQLVDAGACCSACTAD